MNNKTRAIIRDDAAAILAADPATITEAMRRLELARTQLLEARIAFGQPYGHPWLGAETRRVIDHVDELLMAMHDAGGRS